jgi:hypothetical protein
MERKKSRLLALVSYKDAGISPDAECANGGIISGFLRVPLPIRFSLNSLAVVWHRGHPQNPANHMI